MTNFASRISAAAMLALAALPIAALATGAHAAPVSFKVSDLNLASPEGQTAYDQRAEAAGRKFCAAERAVAARTACRAGVKLELSEKLDVIRAAAVARDTQAFAAR